MNNNSKVYLNAATIDESSTDDVIDKKHDDDGVANDELTSLQPIVPPRPSKESASSASTSSASSHHSSPLKKVSTVEVKGERNDEEGKVVPSISSQIHQMQLTEKKDDDSVKTKQTSVTDENQQKQDLVDALPKETNKEQEQSVLSSQHWGPERLVEVVRVPGHGLGISIVGGKIDPLPRKGNKPGSSSAAITGIFIKNVLEGSPAGATGLLCTGDRILEVDGHDLRKASHEKAVEIIRQSGSVVVFVVQSLLEYDDDDDEEEDYDEENTNRDVEATQVTEPMITSVLDNVPSALDAAPPVPPPGFENEYSEQMSNYSDSDQANLPPPPPPPLMEKMDANTNWEEMDEDIEQNEDSDFGDESDESNFTGQVTLPNGSLIDRGSAAFLRKSQKDAEIEDDYGYTKMKVHRKYLKDSQEQGTVKLISLNKGTNGLGISLAGHKDRSQMAIYVCGLNPLGNAARVGGIGILIFFSIKLLLQQV